MWLCWAVVATALAGKWDAEPADVEVSRMVRATPEAVHALLQDWRGFQAVMPEDCVTDWEFAGGGAQRSRARYTYGPMKRRLIGRYTMNQPGHVLETELEGKKGWFLQVTYGEVPGGTMVTWSTPLDAPRKWPIAGPFFNQVRPAWIDCYERALVALDERLAP